MKFPIAVVYLGSRPYPAAVFVELDSICNPADEHFWRVLIRLRPGGVAVFSGTELLGTGRAIEWNAAELASEVWHNHMIARMLCVISTLAALG